MIDILLATYNGEQYLIAQIDSIFAQTFRDWKIIAHDDGSTDNTILILKNYANQYPDKIHLVEDHIITGGAKENFTHLLQHTQNAYIMFCDQDDVWLPNKLQDSWNEMIHLEQQHAANTPIIVHSDLTIVDSNLNIIADSMFSYQCLTRKNQFKSEIIVQNNVTGCSMLLNHNALKCAMPIDDNAIMRDWWIAAKVTLGGGIIHLLPYPTLLYRQHENNTLGARKISISYYLKKIYALNDVVKSYQKIIAQARALGFNSAFYVIAVKAFVLLRRVLLCR